MRRIVFHIGLQKTGTTSLQGFLHRNTEALAKAGFSYPRWIDPSFEVVKAPSYHGHLAAFCADFSCAFAKPSAADVERFLAALPADRTAIISGEDFSRLKDPARAKSLFEGFDVRVIVYLREQTRWMESLFNQGNKILFGRGDSSILHPERLSETSLLEFLRSQGYLRMLDFRELLDPWETAFGSDRITVRVFDPPEFIGGSLFDDFLHQLGITATDGFVDRVNLNESIGNGVLRMLSEIAQADRSLADSVAAEALRQWRTGALDLAGDHEILSAEARARIGMDYAESNAEVARRYLGRETLFRPAGPQSSRPSISPLASKAIGEMIARRGAELKQ